MSGETAADARPAALPSPDASLASAATLLGVLADHSRLRLLAAVVTLESQGARPTASDVLAAAGRGARDGGRDLARLLDCGLLVANGGVLTANLPVLGDAAAAVDEALPITALLAGEPDLARFFRHGRLNVVPTDPAHWSRLARLLVRLLPAGVTLTEAEVNARLGAVHPDHARLRRLLADEGLVERHGSADYRRLR